MHRYPLLLLATLSLAFTSAACDPAPDPGESTVTADPRDEQALAAWLAKPHKSCTLPAVYPHRAAYSKMDRERAQGLDSAIIYDGADANGFRHFDAEGYELARFGDLGEPLALSSYQQDHEGDAASALPPASMRFFGGTCTLTIDGEVVFSADLYQSVTVDVASWPGMERQLVDTGESDVPPKGVLEGFEWLDPMPRLWNLVHPTGSERDIANQIAAWLDDSDGALASRIRVERTTEMLLELDGADWFPPLVIGDGILTLVRAEERERFEALDARVWHWSHTNGGDDVSQIEVSGGADGLALRYVGTRSRQGAGARARASRCVAHIFSRILDGYFASRWGYFPPMEPVTVCATHSSDLVDAVLADPEALALALFAFTQTAVDRYRGATRMYGVRGLPIELAARAIVAELPEAELTDPSQIYADARYSWASLSATSLFDDHPELELPLAEAVLLRALHDDYLDVRESDESAPPLTAEDAHAIAAEAAQHAEPYTHNMIFRLRDAIASGR